MQVMVAVSVDTASAVAPAEDLLNEQMRQRQPIRPGFRKNEHFCLFVHPQWQ